MHAHADTVRVNEEHFGSVLGIVTLAAVCAILSASQLMQAEIRGSHTDTLLTAAPLSLHDSGRVAGANTSELELH